MYLRNMGPHSDTQTLLACAGAAEAVGIDTLWLADHIAIPPDDAAGSGGRYLDPLATAAFLAGSTARIRIGTGVLVLPYRPILPTAKWIATIQELSAHRFRLGVGVGWMDAEFRAVGVPRRQRGKISDDYLRFLAEAFAHDQIESNGQPLLFLPRPPRPEILVGGAAPHALRRAAELGDGWMPFGSDVDVLAPQIAELKRLFEDRGKAAPLVVTITTLAVRDRDQLCRELTAMREVGVSEVVHAWRYAGADEFAEVAGLLAGAAEA
jgi:probable F420-dependent oxidoreductase